MGLPSFFVIKLPRMWIWNQLDQNIYIVPQKRADWDRDFLQKQTAFLQHSAKDVKIVRNNERILALSSTIRHFKFFIQLIASGGHIATGLVQ